jgi:hypothetical protein
MIHIRSAFVTSLAVTAVLVVGVPAAGASAAQDLPLATGPCGTATADGQGGNAGTNSQVCVGTGNATIAPAVGQIATVNGPTITGSATIGTSVQSAGEVAVGAAA